MELWVSGLVSQWLSTSGGEVMDNVPEIMSG